MIERLHFERRRTVEKQPGKTKAQVERAEASGKPNRASLARPNKNPNGEEATCNVQERMWFHHSSACQQQREVPIQCRIREEGECTHP